MNSSGVWRFGRADALIAAYMLVWFAGLAFAMPHGGLSAEVVNLAYFLMGAIATAAHWRAARTARDPRSQRAWWLLACSNTLIWLNGFVWTYWETVVGSAMPERITLLAEQAYIPVAIAAFFSFPVDPAFSWRNARARVDGALFAVGVLVLSWRFSIASWDGSASALTVVGEMGEWVLALAASYALLRARDRSTRASVGLSLSAELVFIMTSFFWMRASSNYAPGHWVDGLWFGAWMLRWLAARRAIHAPVEPSRSEAGYRGSVSPALFVASTYSLLVIALWAESDPQAIDVAIAAAVMTALLLLRQQLTLRENLLLAERTARETAVFRSLVASATDFVLLVRPDLRIAYASPSLQRLTGPAGSSSFTELLHPDDRRGVIDWLEERSSSAGQRSYSCRFQDHAGGWRDIELRAQDRRDLKAVEGFVLNGRDVTQENALERRLGHARKLAMLSAMAGRIAHAYNNALAAMQVYAEELARDLPPDSPAHEDACAIGAAAERGAGITRQLLGFSGRHVIRPEPLRPIDVIEQLQQTFARTLSPARTLEVLESADDATVMIDRAQFEQVLVNLVANARDAMPNGGRVVMTISHHAATETGGAQVRISVADQGTGIAAEMIPRIFEPFFTTKAEGKGTGLGLAMVASIVRRAGGTVDVTSEVGVGTNVTLRLPAAGRLSTPLEPIPTIGVPDAPSAASRHVLLVDDDPLVRRASARMLRRAGFTVIEAEDGTLALSIARDRSVEIDILLTDLMMPGLSGRDVIARFRPLRPGVPIVCITGFAAERDDDHPIALEVSSIVAKPFTSKVLLSAVESALASGAASER